MLCFTQPGWQSWEQAFQPQSLGGKLSPCGFCAAGEGRGVFREEELHQLTASLNSLAKSCFCSKTHPPAA